MPVRLLVLSLPLLLAACMSPCERIEADMRKLNADVIRNPTIVLDGSYITKMQDLAARGVENRCLEERLR